VYVKRIQRPGYHVVEEKTEIGKGKKKSPKNKRRQLSKNAIQKAEINLADGMDLQDVLNI